MRPIHTLTNQLLMNHQVLYHMCRAINAWYTPQAWTGGNDLKPQDTRRPLFRAIRGFFFWDQIEMSGGLGMWTCAGTSALERARLFWMRATLDAWATIRGTELSLPVQGNPKHTDNLSSITLLERQGFEGQDRCLRISLFGYGSAWRTLPDSSVIFIYGIKGDAGNYNAFDRATLDKDHDVFYEHNWVDWGSFFSCIDA